MMKLTALKRHIGQFLTIETDWSIDSSRVLGFADRYGAIVSQLRIALPPLFADLPRREFEVHFIHVDEMVRRTQLTDLLLEAEYCLELLGGISLDDHGVAVRVTREGAFFAGQQFDAIRQIQEIIATANKSIMLIDNYADEKTLDLLSVKAAAATVQLLTHPRSATAAFRSAANAFIQQHGGLSVRVADGYHDRFVFLDGVELFHFGASLKDAGKRAFMFSRIEETTVIEALVGRFRSDWVAAAVIV